jgi:hypothetical protein
VISADQYLMRHCEVGAKRKFEGSKISHDFKCFFDSTVHRNPKLLWDLLEHETGIQCLSKGSFS